MTDATVDDIRMDDGSELYVVRPSQSVGTAVMFLHWFDEAPNANRTQFLEEAKVLAALGVTAALPQLRFPWESPPKDTESDLRRIAAEKEKLLEVRHLLAQEAERIALVGHDFGAMHGMQLFGEIELSCAVLIAPTARWSDWFLPFWQIDSDRYDYMRRMSSVDPIAAVARADAPMLFQFGTADFYIAEMTAHELHAAAPEPKEMIFYESGHAMDDDVIAADRMRFLVEKLGL